MVGEDWARPCVAGIGARLPDPHSTLPGLKHLSPQPEGAEPSAAAEERYLARSKATWLGHSPCSVTVSVWDSSAGIQVSAWGWRTFRAHHSHPDPSAPSWALPLFPLNFQNANLWLRICTLRQPDSSLKIWSFSSAF